MAQLIQVGTYIESLLRQQRREGQSLEDVSPEEKAAERNAVLETLILRRAKAEAPEEEVEAILAAAAEKMGAYDIAIARDPETIAQGRKMIDFSAPEG